MLSSALNHLLGLNEYVIFSMIPDEISPRGKMGGSRIKWKMSLIYFMTSN